MFGDLDLLKRTHQTSFTSNNSHASPVLVQGPGPRRKHFRQGGVGLRGGDGKARHQANQHHKGCACGFWRLGQLIHLWQHLIGCFTAFWLLFQISRGSNKLCPTLGQGCRWVRTCLLCKEIMGAKARGTNVRCLGFCTGVRCLWSLPPLKMGTRICKTIWRARAGSRL